MPTYRVIALDQKFAWRVRANLRAPDFGYPAYVEVARGAGPCLVCLRTFRVGRERQILFTYDPFRNREPFPLPGPVHIHERGCTPHRGDRLPVGLADRPLTLNAYASGGQEISLKRVVGAMALESAVDRLLADPAVAYLHVRNTDAGRFVCELTRL